nr:heme-binding beta-barrel domain-containing protein [uncultured Sphingomonas sp.]
MKFPAHLFDEPSFNPNTLEMLGPLKGLAGRWEGAISKDVKPTADGAKPQEYVEHLDIQPIDAQTNGPQLLYGLRYHAHMVKPDQTKTYHDQVGYWLWEPATGNIYFTLAIPRAQTLLAFGNAAADATSFTVSATRGTTENGICSPPFLEENFRTDDFSMTVTIEDGNHWSYAETTTLMIKGVAEPFEHTDRNRLHRIAAPIRNPLAGGESL